MLGNQTSQDKKKVILSVNRPQKNYEVEISPGETFSQIMERVGLRADDYIALKPDGTQFLPNDAVWPHVSDGSKVHINMRSDVGSLGFFSWLQPRRPPRLVPRMRTYAQDLGWGSFRNPDGTIQHQGFYHTRRQRWQGKAVQRGQQFTFFILTPPMERIKGTKWENCFHAIATDGWWLVSFVPGTEPKDLDSGIQGIIKILEVCSGRVAAVR